MYQSYVFNYVGIWFVIVRKFVLLNNCPISGLQKNLFLTKSDIPNFSYAITFVFSVSFSTSELPSKCLGYNDIFLMTLGLRFLWYVCIRYRNNVIIKFRFGSSLCLIFYYVTITSFICSMQLHLLMTSELRYNLVRLNSVWKLRYNYVSFLLVNVTYFYYVTITLLTFSLYFCFLRTLKLQYIFVRSNYVQKSRYKTVIF